MAKMVKIALAQVQHRADPLLIVQSAVGKGAEIVVFPEMFSNGYATFESEVEKMKWRASAIGLEDKFLEQFRRAALKYKIYVVAPFLEASDPDPYNTAIVIGRNGETLLTHRKVFTSFFDSPESACAVGKGFESVDIKTSVGPVKIGLLICMDREYPEAAKSLSAAGVEIALVPNCCDLADDPDVGDVRLAQVRGRAFETVMGIAVANYPRPKCDGHSFAVDPLGRVIAIADDGPELLIASFDLDQIRKKRKEEWFRWRQ